MNTIRYAIVVAGGNGLRMGSKIPKQFLEMKGKPIVMHTMAAFQKCSKDIRIILVLPPQHIELWHNLVIQHQCAVPHTVQAGGATRFQSVKAGLAKISGSGLVAIHDGVRPVVTERIINESYEMALASGSGIASIDLIDSIRKVVDDVSLSQDRTNFKLVQTPQTFDVQLIKQAYELPEKTHYTDDATVWEAAGHQVSLFEGGHENIKITTFRDLVLAEVLLKFI